jgi:hypothetical protein
MGVLCLYQTGSKPQLASCYTLNRATVVPLDLSVGYQIFDRTIDSFVPLIEIFTFDSCTVTSR